MNESSMAKEAAWFAPGELENVLVHACEGNVEIAGVLTKAVGGTGLSLAEAAVLLKTGQVAGLEDASRQVRRRQFGKEMALFAPLYLSNACVNDCLYCGFRRGNKTALRKTLNIQEVVEEARALVEQGHGRILLVSSENPRLTPVSYVAKAVDAVLAVAGVHQVEVEIGSFGPKDMEEIRNAGAQGFVLFQETYQPETYSGLHPKGRKTDFLWRLTAPERAIAAGLRVGLGALFGLYDWRYETLALISHAQHLREKTGAWPATVSVPRLRPAEGAIVQEPPYPVQDVDLKRIISVLRLALPAVGIVLSTREPEDLRDDLVDSGVTTMSAGSRTNPGGYSLEETGEQFPVEDHRSLAEIRALIENKGFEIAN